MSININLDLGGQAPSRATDGSAGYDLHSTESFTIAPGQIAKVGTGVRIDFPDGIHGEIMPRSGLAAKYGIDTLAGLIDGDFSGEIIVIMINHGNSKCHFEAGDRIAQLVFRETITPDLALGEVVEKESRGGRGFGSTGLKSTIKDAA